MSNSKGSILISNANAVGTALVNKLGGTGYTPNEWSDKINLLGIADADIPTALAGITEGSYAGEDRGAIKICNANNVGTMLNKKFNINRGFKPSEWESAISKLTALTTDTASGSVVSIADGADDVPVVNCIASVDPVQDLHGYSKPWPAGGGSNLWNEIWELGAINITNGQNVDNNNFIRSTNYIPVLPNTVYYKCSSQNILQLYYAIDNSYIGYESWGKDSTFTTPDNCYFVRFYVAQEYGTTYNNDIAINYPSSVTTYSPYSNICPISGNTETTVYQFGKNLLDDSKRIYLSGNIIFGRNTGLRDDFCLRLKAGTYTFSVTTADGTAPSLYIKNSDTGTMISGFPAYAKFLQTFTLDEDTNLAVFAYKQGYTTVDDILTAQIELGSIATAYEPYKAKTPITIQFNKTVYGADVDAKSGNNNITYGTMQLPDTGWRYYQTSGKNTFNITIPNCKNAFALCEVYPYEYHQYISAQSDKTFMFYVSGSNINISICDNSFDNAVDFGNFIGGKQLVYQLETPQPFTTDPNEISTYKNNNVFYNTTGDTSVTYYKGV